MDEYRRQQSLKWGGKTVESPPLQQPPRIINIDSSSLNSITDFITSSGGLPRTGILFGSSGNEEITIDAIYETSQDVITGEPLVDSRLTQVRNLSFLMGLKPLGLLDTISSPQEEERRLPSLLIRVCGMHNFASHILLIIMSDKIIIYEPTDFCFTCVKNKTLKKDTTLKGPTVHGGLNKKDLVRILNFTKREVNIIIHTGFFRLNRPDHIPTIEDAKAFLFARKDISELYLKLADYHLILFLADFFGESMGERIILSIFREDDELVKDFMEILF